MRRLPTGAVTSLFADLDQQRESLVCPTLVGRARQLASLDRALDGARRGTGQTVVVAGEAGVGKSRLIAELKRRAADAGARILQGACFEPDRSLPYAPLLDLLGALLSSSRPDESAALLGSRAAELVGLLPELAPWLPDVVPRLLNSSHSAVAP